MKIVIDKSKKKLLFFSTFFDTCKLCPQSVSVSNEQNSKEKLFKICCCSFFQLLTIDWITTRKLPGCSLLSSLVTSIVSVPFSSKFCVSTVCKFKLFEVEFLKKHRNVWTKCVNEKYIAQQNTKKIKMKKQIDR